MTISTTADAATPSRGKLTPVSAPQFESGRYVVVLREPAAATDAGVRGGPATRARTGQYNARSDAAQRYTNRLIDTHRAVAGSVGARVAHDYTNALNGFAARLSGRQAAELASDRRVALVAPDRRLQLNALPDSSEFLGMTGRRGVWARHGGPARAGAGMVVGILDTGIWPESKSFAGKKLTRAEKTRWDIRRRGEVTFMDKVDGTRFQGRCMLGDNWRASDCNTKLIGARYYPDIFELVEPEHVSPTEWESTRDGNGHGTHTAGTAAGNHGVRAGIEGVDFGRISGMAPAARIAAYKVCYDDDDATTGDCYTSASVAAIDDAVADGVDTINYSIGGSADSILDPVQIAFEGAAEAGIFVATSAGNDGPDASTVGKPSPWMTNVAASTWHNFENTVVLGNGQRIVGASSNDTPLRSTPLRRSSDVALAGADATAAGLCGPDTLDPAEAAGNIIVCIRGTYDRVAKSAEVARAGGVGMILANPSENSIDPDFHAVPTVHIPVEGTEKVEAYLEQAGDAATASFAVGNLTKRKTPLPQIAGFSSRGPSLGLDADILKPDIAAPGASVIAAVSPPSNSDRKFDLYSGTSMASPHIAGLATFIAGVHPRWTPMQVKSAMMTTATNLLGPDGTPTADPFAQGAGHVNPRRFFNPGLFVTSDHRQWRGLMTAEGFNTGTAPIEAKDINQPSMAKGQVAGSVKFTRQFVADRAGVWDVRVRVPGFEVDLNRERIRMGYRGDVEDLKLNFVRTDAPLTEFATGFVTLTGPTKVRIPVALRPVSVDAPAEVDGTGTTGSVDVPVTAGFTGALDVNEYGLAAAETAQGSVETDDSHFYCVTVPESARVLRADADAADNTADLDLYGYLLEGDCDSDAVAVAGESATAAADESFTLLDPPAGSYVIEVNGYAAAPGQTETDYVLDTFVVDDSTTLGNFRAVPNPVPVVAGEPTTFEAQWTGLGADARYLGVLEYEGSLGPTVVHVDTSTP